LKRAGIVACLGLVVAAGGATPVPAHTGGSTGYASITVHHSTVRYRVTLPTAALTS